MSPPHPAEYTSARHALAQDCATLQLIDSNIDECRTRIAHALAQIRLLERQRDAVQHRVSVHRARLSPLRTIPDQVLQEIFRHCLPDTHYIVPDARSAPLLLTHVCRRWRVVTLGSSELWSSIALHDRGVWNYELEVDMVKRWLGRSHMRPVRMSIECHPCTDFGLHGNASSRSGLSHVAIAHSVHLRDLSLNVDEVYLRRFMDHAENLPELRSISVSLHSAQRGDDEQLPATVRALDISAPRLRCIALKGNGTPIDLFPRNLFPQITHLSLEHNSTFDPALLFRDFPNLQHLALMLTLHPPDRDSTADQQRRILGPSLLDLEVRLDEDVLDFGDPIALETLLDQLELPALQTLAIVVPAPQQQCRPPVQVGGAERESARPVSVTVGEEANKWENRVSAWVHSPGVNALLSHSSCRARARLEVSDSRTLRSWPTGASLAMTS